MYKITNELILIKGIKEDSYVNSRFDFVGTKKEAIEFAIKNNMDAVEFVNNMDGVDGYETFYKKEGVK